MSWVPIFDGILDSTVWELPPSYVKVWVTLLALKDDEGNVWCTDAALARRAKLKPSIVKAALDIFLAPDPESRSQAHEGRRLLPLSRGWKVVNHEVYQDKMMGKKGTRKNRVATELEPGSSQKRNQLGINSETSGVVTIENRSVPDSISSKKSNLTSTTAVEAVEVEVEVGSSTTPPWNQESCWLKTVELWKEAQLPSWKDKAGKQQVDGCKAKDVFFSKITEKDWPEFWKKLTWAVETRFQNPKGQYSILNVFIKDGEWKHQSPPPSPSEDKSNKDNSHLWQ